jgi:hypothetical protein
MGIGYSLIMQRGVPESKFAVHTGTEKSELVKVTEPVTVTVPGPLIVPELEQEPVAKTGSEFDIKDPPAELMIFYIQGLPPDVKKLIFADHFRVPLQYRKIQYVLKLPRTQCIDTTEIYKFIPKIFSDSKLNQYMCRENELFSRLWTAHLQGKRYFVNIICPKQDFALSWLMHLYH